MRTSDGNKVQTYQQELKTARRQLRRVKFHWGGTKGRPRKKRTGQPAWFAAMKQEAAFKVHLSKLPVSQLAVHGICSANQATALHEAGLITIWDVVKASYADMMKVKGFGPKTLGKLWQDMKIKGQISPKWTPPNGR